MNITNWNLILKKLEKVYTRESAVELVEDLQSLTGSPCDATSENTTSGFQELSQGDIALISYADSVTSGTLTPIATLEYFIDRYDLEYQIPIVHILPFYPWDTDRGFSVKNYYQVNPGYGSWDDCKHLSESVRLMYDFVANHASIDNPLVQNALIVEHLDPEDPDYESLLPYQDYVIIYTEEERPSDETLKSLARPRAFPVLTSYRVFKREDGSKRALLGPPQAGEDVIGTGYVWTTFSRAKRADGTEDTRQVDLNFKNPAVFLETIKVLFFYLENKAEVIRLDAIGYLWKRLGSSSIHEPECLRLIEVLNDVLKLTAPQVVTVAEVNEPQEKAFKYVGTKETPGADMAYQFSHFSLAIHAVLTGQAKYYTRWFESTRPFEGRQFTTVLGSHDGLAMKQARELLPEAEFAILTHILVEEHRALPNMGFLPGGEKIIYEVCSTPWNLINNVRSRESFEQQLQRYLAVTALGLCVRGIPALYFQGLFGARNYSPTLGLDENRTINREIFHAESLYPVLDNPETREGQIFRAVLNLCEIRKKEPAFNPHNGFEVIKSPSRPVVAILLKADDPKDNILSVINVGMFAANPGIDIPENYVDILTGENPASMLRPYQVWWLKAA